MKNRIVELDIAKGLGILLVIVGHIIPENLLLHRLIYTFHMPLFFILSGCVVKEDSSKKSLFEVISDECALVSQYILWSFIYIIYDLLIRVVVESKSISLIVWDLYTSGTLFGINVLWFLSTLFIAKILFRAIPILKTRGATFLCGGFCILGIFVGGGLNQFLECELVVFKFIFYPACTIVRSISLLFFLQVGFMLRKIICNLNSSRHRVWVYVGILIWCLLAPLSGNVDVHLLTCDNLILFLPVALSGSFLVIANSYLIAKLDVLTRIFGWLGKNSLFIMVTHEYFHVRKIATVLSGFVMLESEYLNYMIQFLVCIIIEIILCLIFADKMKNISNIVSSCIKKRILF